MPKSINDFFRNSDRFERLKAMFAALFKATMRVLKWLETAGAGEPDPTRLKPKTTVEEFLQLLADNGGSLATWSGRFPNSVIDAAGRAGLIICFLQDEVGIYFELTEKGWNALRGLASMDVPCEQRRDVPRGAAKEA